LGAGRIEVAVAHTDCGSEHLVVATAALAEEIFAGAADRDAAAVFPSDAIATLHQAGLPTAPFPPDLGGAGLIEPVSVDTLRDVLRLLGGGDLAIGRLYEGHVNAVALVARYGTRKQLSRFAEDVRAGALSGVWNAEGQTAVTLEQEGGTWFCAAPRSWRRAWARSRGRSFRRHGAVPS